MGVIRFNEYDPSKDVSGYGYGDGSGSGRGDAYGSGGGGAAGSGDAYGSGYGYGAGDGDGTGTGADKRAGRSMTEATPRPWAYQEEDSPNSDMIVDAYGVTVAMMVGFGSKQRNTGELIVRAVNNYDEALALLREAQQLVAEREYLEQHEFYYAEGAPEPSPAEWGVSVCYQQTAEAGPKDQFGFDVRDYHVGNKHEHDEDSGGTMTLANRIDAFLKENNNG